MTKLLVYGTLRKGLINYNHYLKGLKPLDTIKLKEYTMYDLGGYPMVMIDKKGKGIVVEVYDVPDILLEVISRMETGAGYKLHYEAIGGEDHVIFVYTTNIFEAPSIEGGDYVQYIEEYKAKAK